MIQLIPVIVISIIALSCGAFVYLKPLRTFEIQKRFYALINWKIEPISIENEIRNTKIMGLFLMVFVIGVWGYLLFF